MASFKPEEVVLIRRRPESSSGGSYDVFSLEESVEDGGRTSFKLARAHVAAADVTQDLSNSLLVEQVPESLHSGPSRKVHVLVSTGSGTGRALEFHEAVLRPLLDALGLVASEEQGGGDAENRYNFVTTTDAQSIRQFGRSLDDAGGVKHTVVLLSGDGGIVELLNAKAPADNDSEKVPSPPVVAVLPLGTGNALFNSVHKLVMAPKEDVVAPSSLVQALRTLFTGTAAPLPSFRAAFSPGSRLITYTADPSPRGTTTSQEAAGTEVKEHTDAVSHLYGAIVASYGFHSQLVWESDTPAYRKHGAQRFGMVAQELLKESHAYDAVVEIAGGGSSRSELKRDRHAYVLATLVSNLEKMFTISPASRPLDGKLRLVHFGDVGGKRTMDIMVQAYDNGKHVDMRWAGEDGREEKVGYEEVSEVRVTTREHDPRWRKVCIDGTIVEIPQNGSMTVTVEERSQLQILVDRSVLS